MPWPAAFHFAVLQACLSATIRRTPPPYYGYKLHMATDAKHGFIIGGHVTPANTADTKELMEVVTESKIPSGSMVFADKGYASNNNRCDLEEKQLTDGIMYKAARGRQLTEPEKMVNRVISGLRGIVERGFGTLKKDYRFQRTRYLGCAKVKLEFLLNAMAFNLKKAAIMVRQCANRGNLASWWA